MEKDKLKRKASLFLTLCSNNYTQAEILQKRECVRCRERHGGICNIRYYNGEIGYYDSTKEIVDFSLYGCMNKELVYNQDGEYTGQIRFNEKLYEYKWVMFGNNILDWDRFCFGFLADE